MRKNRKWRFWIKQKYLFMDQLKDKGFVIIMFVILFGSIGYAYWHFVIDRNYTLVYHADCDPTVEVCYVWECDPDAIEEEEKCTGDPEEDIWYYKHMERLAKNVPECTTDDEECDAFVCKKDEVECGEVICTEETAEIDEVTCSEPDAYNMAHPEALEEDEESEEGEEMDEDAEMGEEKMINEEESDLNISEDGDVMEEMDGGETEVENMVIPASSDMDTSS